MEMAEAFPGWWTVVGAHMVALYAWEAGLSPRPSNDVDVLVNVRLAANGTEEISRYLRARDYDPEISRNGLAHLFKRGTAQIDVLAPDGLGARAKITTVPPNRTVRVPGGTQALSRSRPIEVRSRDVEGLVPRPSLLGAILIKIRAISVDDLPDAQRADVALLLRLVQDPDELAREISRAERGWLRSHVYFADPADDHWDAFETDDREQSALVYRRLLAG
ncbi:MAG: hypothetical protein WD067_08285 [Gaiellaceae bacterium]